MLLAAGRILVETRTGRFARTFVFIEHQLDHREGGVRRDALALFGQVLEGLLTDMAHQAHGHFVADRQRADRHAGLARFVLDHRRRHAFAEHGDAFVGEGAEHARGEETAAVVDHNRGLVDLHDVVETARQGLVTGALALDDFHQGHLVHRAEEMQADELVLFLHRSGQAGDRQGRGVGGDQRIRQRDPFGRGGDIGLEVAILEYRLDDQVAACKVGVLVGGLDPRQDAVALVGTHLAAADLFLQQLDRIALALLGRFQRDVLEHHLDTGHGRDIGNARTHHAGAEHADLARDIGRKTLRPRATGIDLVELEPEGADHVLRHLAGGQFGEVARLDDLRGVEVDLGALDRGAHDLLRGGETAFGLVAQNRGGDGEHLRHIGARRGAAGDLVALAIPGLHGIRVGQDPGPGLGQQVILVAGQFIDQAGLERGIRAHLLAFEQIRQGLFQAEQAHHAHHPAAAGQQAEGHFRQAELHAGTVQGNAVVTRQADFPAAPQGRTVDRRHHRFAQGFQAAQLALERQDHLVERLGIGLGDLDQFIEIAAGKEGLLRRGDDHPGNAALLGFQARDGFAHGLAVLRVHGVGTLAGHIDGQNDDSVPAFFVTDGVSHFKFSSQMSGERFRGVASEGQARRKSFGKRSLLLQMSIPGGFPTLHGRAQ